MTVRKPMSAAVAGLCVVVCGMAFASASAFAEKIYVPGIPFGAPGSGPGQLSEPVGVAVNDASPLLEPVAGGDVYVVDRGNDRVERFSESGQYEGQFDGGATYEVRGGKQEPTTAAPSGVFSSPGAIAVNDAQTSPSFGDVYVDYKGNDKFEPDRGGPKAIDEFSPVGGYLGDIAEAVCVPPEEGRQRFEENQCKAGEDLPFDKVLGMAVDRSGDLWVLYSLNAEGHKIDPNNPVYIGEFSETGTLIEALLVSGDEQHSSFNSLLVDSAHNMYTVRGEYGWLEKYASSDTRRPLEGEESLEWYAQLGSGASTATINPVTNNLIVDEVGSIALLGPFGEPYTHDIGKRVTPEPVESFPKGGLPESLGVAVSSESTVYASEVGADRVQSFDFLPAPVVKVLAPSGVSETGLTLQGTVNPEGEEITECYFEYGVEAGVYTGKAPCVPTAGEIGKGIAAVPVSAQLSGLALASVRSFRVVAVNGHGVVRESEGMTVSRPVLAGAAVSDAGKITADAGASIDPGGLQTCYRVEYGPSAAYGQSTPQACAGAGAEPVSVSVELTGLQPASSYHFRFVASNALGVSAGADVVFNTFATSSGLPDGRAYELVSAVGAGSSAEAYVPYGMISGAALDFGGAHGLPSGYPFEAAADGDALVYAGTEGATTGGNGNVVFGHGEEFLAARSAGGGWMQSDLEMPNSRAYKAFSEDLSVGVIDDDEDELAASAPFGYDKLYSHLLAGSAYEPLLTVAPEERTPETFDTNGNFGYFEADQFFTGMGFAGANAGTSGVPAFSHVLFEASAKLASTPEAPSVTESENNLYDSVGGRLYLVNVLPDGTAQARATFGRQGPGLSGFVAPVRSNVISADGSRVFWSAVQPVGLGKEEGAVALFVRENDTQPQSEVEDGECTEPGKACTVQVDQAEPGAEGPSGGGQFLAASSNGSRVFFTDENRLTKGSKAQAGQPDLYEYDLAGPEGERLTDLSVPVKGSGGGDVQGVLGTSQDGAYVYFAADGVLSEGKNSEGDEPVENQPNLYLRHGGRTVFVATLTAGDGDYYGASDVAEGDWVASAGRRTAEVTPDGQSVVFMSRAPLTGYNNVLDGTSLTEVFVYDAGTGRLSCASCNPSGEAPVAPATEITSKLGEAHGSFLPTSESLVGYQPRVISGDGGRVFFDSIEPLVPDDSNGYLDVYEWEAPGEGSCTSQTASTVTGGCTFLLSGGQGGDNSYLIDASSNGDDVFLVSRELLLKAVRGQFDEVFDARVGGVQPPEESRCSGTACQGVPPAPPIFATPASVTFNGVGNFPPPVEAVKAAKKKTSKCAKGERRSHGRCVKVKRARKKAKAKRSSHERRASR